MQAREISRPIGIVINEDGYAIIAGFMVKPLCIPCTGMYTGLATLLWSIRVKPTLDYTYMYMKQRK